MVPIFEQGHKRGIGHSFESFIKRFIDICEDDLTKGRAKAFAFIFYDFQDQQIHDILQNQDGFTKLDRLAGKDLSVFYLHSNNRQLSQAFNDIFLGAFEIKGDYQLPFVLFFKVNNREVDEVEVFELGQTDLIFAFKELYETLDNYIERTNDKSIKKTNPTAGKLTEIWKTTKKVALDKVVSGFWIKVPRKQVNSFDLMLTAPRRQLAAYIELVRYHFAG